MTGVEILATEEVVVAFGFNWLAFFLSIIICAFLGLAIGCASSEGNCCMSCCIGAFIGVLFGAAFGLFSGHVTEKPTVYETQYKVTVSDETPMNEFMKKYEIVDQEGRIYTVRER